MQANTRLQWGRRVNATESVNVWMLVSALVSLQWGRRVNATESKLAFSAMLGGDELQWGRRVNATERRPRLCSTRPPIETLQWGRRVNATESPAHRLTAALETLASMGPPRERDGEVEDTTDKLEQQGKASMGPPRERDGEPR